MSASASASLEGLAYSRLNVDLQQYTPHEDNLEWRNKVFLGLVADTDHRTRAVFSLLAEHKTLVGVNTRYHYGLNLYEGYVRLRRDDYDFYIGSQIVDWSLADISILDSVNPRNLEEFIAREDEFTKIPVPMLRLSYMFDDSTLEALYVPFYTPSYFELFGSDWALLSNESMGSYEGEIDTDAYLSQGLRPGIDKFPPPVAVNGTVGARWHIMGDAADYQFTLLNGWSLFPLFDFDKEFSAYLAAQPAGARRTLETLEPQEAIAFNPLYKSRPVRQTQAGFGALTIAGHSTVQGEISVVHPQEFYTNAFELSQNTVVSAIVGADRFLPFNLYANISYLGAFVGGYPEDGLYLIDPYNHFLIAFLRGSYAGERFTPELRSFVNLQRGDYVLNPRFPFRIAANTQLTAGAYVLEGSPDTIFGMFQGNSFVYTQLRYAF